MVKQMILYLKKTFTHKLLSMGNHSKTNNIEVANNNLAKKY